MLSGNFPVGDFIESIIIHISDSLSNYGDNIFVYFNIQFIWNFLLYNFAEIVCQYLKYA